MSWLVIGGTSGIGLATCARAAKLGLDVTAFSRSADTASLPDGVKAHAGDALTTDDLRAALSGKSVVVQALGVKERPGMLWEEETLFSTATRVLLPLLDELNITRLLTVTGFGAGKSRASMSAPFRLGHDLLLGKVYADKARQEDLINQTELDWTIVRPTLLSEGVETQRYKVLTDPDSWRMGLISRRDVAHFLVEAGHNTLHLRETVVLA